MYFDKTQYKSALNQSQSLWNRAMYFDDENEAVSYIEKVSIPLEQGNVFRH